MLGLRQKIRRDKRRIRRIVSNNKNLTRPRQSIDVDIAEYETLGARDPDVSRSNDLVHARQFVRAIRERRDRLGATSVENARDACEVSCSKKRIVGSWCRENDVFHAGNSRRDRGHQDAGWISRFAPWSVHTHAFERTDAQAENDAFFFVLKARIALMFVVPLDANSRAFQSVTQRGIETSESGSSIKRSQDERAWFTTFEALHIFAHSRATVCPDARHDFAHCRFDRR